MSRYERHEVNAPLEEPAGASHAVPVSRPSEIADVILHAASAAD